MTVSRGVLQLVGVLVGAGLMVAAVAAKTLGGTDSVVALSLPLLLLGAVLLIVAALFACLQIEASRRRTATRRESVQWATVLVALVCVVGLLVLVLVLSAQGFSLVG